MTDAAIESRHTVPPVGAEGHRAWVRISHWVVALSVLTLACSGFIILMAHPRLYWGEVGNDLMPALLELPISNNRGLDGWQQTVTFSELPSSPISANRINESELFNQNGWARSLHFLAGWFLVIAGAFYALAGLGTGHIWRDLLPRARELVPRALWHDLKSHLRRESSSAGGGPPYGVLQRCAYVLAAFIVLPFMVLTGLSMSPAVTAAYPILTDVFGGYQSARTLHFTGFTVLIVFLIVHVAMVVLTGFRRQLRAMIVGN
jgi:thiosulfate reductase cytochrome b subunit